MGGNCQNAYMKLPTLNVLLNDRESELKKENYNNAELLEEKPTTSKIAKNEKSV